MKSNWWTLDKRVFGLECNRELYLFLGTVLGILIAKYLQRAVYLPSLQIDSNVSLPFSSMYNSTALETILASHHIQIMKSGHAVDHGMAQVISCEDLSLGKTLNCMEKIKGKFFTAKHVVLACPYPNDYVAPIYVTRNKRLFWEVVDNLHPTDEIQTVIEVIRTTIRAFSRENGFAYTQGLESIIDLQTLLDFNGFQNFNFLWSSGMDRSMSFRNSLGMPLQDFDFPKELVDANYSSMLNFYVGLMSDKTISNTNTTFGALLFLERRHNRDYSAPYYADRSSLLNRLPILELPWVFFHNTSNQIGEYMLKVAVKSALMANTLQPVCILIGEQTPVYEWLMGHNITVIFHNPEWTRTFYEKASMFWEKQKEFQFTKEQKVATLKNAVQVDIPAIDGLRQFDYVLYTTPNVLFRGKLTIDMFGATRPPIALGRPDAMAKFPFESSVVLWNVAGGLANYKPLVAYVEDQHRSAKSLTVVANGFNMSLRDALEKWALSDEIVSEAYRGYDDSLVLVDFYEMTPQDFARSIRAGSCPHNICLNGIFKGWCGYIFEVFSMLEKDDLQFGLPVMQECYSKICLFRGGCQRWKAAIAAATQQ